MNFDVKKQLLTQPLNQSEHLFTETKN